MFARGFAGLTMAMNSIGTTWVFCLMFLICADVAGRELFSAPIRGVAEMVGYSIVTALFLQFAHTLHIGRFTRAELVIERIEQTRPAAGHLLNTLYNALGAAVFGVVAWGTWPKLERAWSTSEITGVPGDFTFIIWPFVAIIVFGATVTAFEFVIRLCGSITGVVTSLTGSRDGESAGWGTLAIFILMMGVGIAVALSGLSNFSIGLVSILLMLILIYWGMPIGLVMIVLGFVGMWLIRGDPTLGIRAISRSSSEYLNSYFFGVVPLFVLMGLLVGVSDIGRETFEVARWALRRVKGGLGVATVLANAVFAAITGSSIASAAVFTKVATPEMMRHGYTPRFSVGVVAGSSVLGMLIPPSLLLIIYGFLAEESVGKLFIAAIVPGLILAAMMGLAIVLAATFRPSYVGGRPLEDEEGESIRSAAIKLLPILILIIVVLGGIYGGVFTPTEAGAAGALGALVIATVARRLTWQKLWTTMVETGHITVTVLFLILGARILSQMLAMSGMPQQLGTMTAEANLGLIGFTLVFIALVLMLGTILDSVSIMVITLPLAIPVVNSLGGDLVWFGIIAVIAIETGLLTPPFGLSCYVVKSILDDSRVSLVDIFVGASPFVIIMLIEVAILIAFPGLCLLLI